MSYNSDEDFHLEFDLITGETEYALEFRLKGTKKEVWIPKSQIHEDNVGNYEQGDTNGSCMISGWIANEKGLVS